MNILKTPVTNFLDNLTLIEFITAWYQLDDAPALCMLDNCQLFEMFKDRFEDGLLGPRSWPLLFMMYN